MKRFIRWNMRLYGVVFRLYPFAFRNEFRDETQLMFLDQLAAAGQRGFIHLHLASLREFYDFPRVVVSEHWPGLTAPAPG